MNMECHQHNILGICLSLTKSDFEHLSYQENLKTLNIPYSPKVRWFGQNHDGEGPNPL